ncbi:MAG: helix-turn-helix transcriptional regulator [Anaeroplasmataceae bacterium]|nr:helix-turn-helix transcriptional regulator [Anaeroplasmataceae bacterium]
MNFTTSLLLCQALIYKGGVVIVNFFHKNFIFIIEKKQIILSNMAKKIGITRQAINEYKKGKYPTYDNLIKISYFLDITIDDLLTKDLSSSEE